MRWKKWGSKTIVPCQRLVDEHIEYHHPRKGYIPVLVGCDDECAERFLVPVKLFNDPSIAKLLEMAVQEFGYQREGTLRLPCDAEYFQHVVDEIPQSR